MSLTLSEALELAQNRLIEADVPDAEVDAQWLLCHICQISRSVLFFNKESPLTNEQENLFNQMLARREKREPLQHILGTQPFCGLNLKTDSRALIPRDETQLLAELSISLCKTNSIQTVLDIGTGSGAIALAIKYAYKALNVTAVDISLDALALAKENATIAGLQIELLQSDIFSALNERSFDLIVSNPPYIPSKDIKMLEPEVSVFEPNSALDGGENGLFFYEEIIKNVKEHLNGKGIILFEAGIGQASIIAEMLKAKGFTSPQIVKDYSKIDRIVWAKG